MPYICDGCGRRGAPSAKEEWYQGTSGEAMDDAEVIDIVYLCPQCFQRLDQEEKPRWGLVVGKRGNVGRALERPNLA